MAPETRWPNEPADYRTARATLLEKEAALRRSIEEVAELRRQLPDGGAAKEDYRFADAATDAEVRLSALFGAHDTLVLYNLMYGGAQTAPCAMCVSMLDSLDRNAAQIAGRAALAVVAKADTAALRALAAERGWQSLRLLSSAGNSYNRDYGAETADGGQLPMMHVWRRTADGVRHFWASELLDADVPDWRSQPRHVDAIWPLWNLFDLTPEGRGTDWYPSLAPGTAS
ncbi:MAG: DUF899 family protein [Pseudomonadota bacterium]